MESIRFSMMPAIVATTFDDVCDDEMNISIIVTLCDDIDRIAALYLSVLHLSIRQ